MSDVIQSLKNTFGTGSQFHERFAPVPWTILGVAFAADTVSGHRQYLPETIRDLLPRNTEISIATHYAHGLSLILSIPAAVTGLVEFWNMATGVNTTNIKNRADAFDKHKSVEQNKQNAKELARDVVHSDEVQKLSLGTLHGVLNIAILSIAGYNFFTRRSLVSLALNPSNTQTWLSTAGLVLTIITGYAGKTLASDYGVGR